MRNNHLLSRQNFQTVILDEAAQCPEFWTWGLFRKEVRRFIMAGDPKQLPATVSKVGETLLYSKSMMERLMELGVGTTSLDTQRRMHPIIAEFPNMKFYNGMLKTQYTVHSSECPVKIKSISGNEVMVGTSYYNDEEAIEIIDQYVKYRETYHDIVIIVPYRKQLNHLLSVRRMIGRARLCA